MGKLYKVGPIGFVKNDNHIKPHSIINENLQIEQDNNVIQLTQDDVDTLIKEGYVANPTPTITPAKFEVGQLVKVTQISNKEGVLVDNERLTASFPSKEVYNMFANGVVSARTYSEEQDAWTYKVVGLSQHGLSSEIVYVVRAYGETSEEVYEDDLEPVDELNFLINLGATNKNKVKIKIEKK